MLEEVTDGAIYIENVKINDPKTNINEIRAEVGMVFQQFNLFPHMTVIDNVTMAPMQIRKMSRTDAEALGHELLKRLASIARHIIILSSYQVVSNSVWQLLVP